MSPILASRNIKSRDDIIDQSLMPSGECDLNYRHIGTTYGFGSLTTYSLFLLLVCAAIGAFLWWQQAAMELILLLSVGGVLLFVLVTALRGSETGSAGKRLVVAALSVAGVLGFICLSVGSVRSVSSESLIRVLVLLWLCCIVWSADRFTKHVVWWATAHSLVPHRLMKLGRLLWNDRFAGRVNLETLARNEEEAGLLVQLQTGPGFALRVVALVISALILVLNAQQSAPAHAAWTFVLSMTAIEIVGLLVIWIRNREAVSYYLRMLHRWLLVDTLEDAPAYLWQSPLGRSKGRQQPFLASMVIIAVILLSMAIPPAAILLANGSHPSGLIVSMTGLLLMGLALVVLTIFLLSVPAILKYRRLFTTGSSPLLEPGWTRLDGLADRLRNSANPLERGALFFGVHPDTGFPILVSINLLFEHQMLVGATGTGKTALGLINQIIQLIRQRDGAVIILDCKGDPAMFETARLEAKRSGRTFKWFTNKPGRSTYVFNPVNQAPLTQLTLPQLVGYFMQCLNLYHGEDYGRGWFSMASRMLFQNALLEMMQNDANKRPFSFREIEKVIERIAADKQEFRDDRHLAYMISVLSQMEQLNFSPVRNPGHPAIRNGIHMPDVIEKNQVVYFHLVGAQDVASVGQIARMAIYSANNAAIDYHDRTGKRPNAHILVDEAQLVLAQNFEVLLAQGRSHGLAFNLAFQTMSQLNRPGGADLREMVVNNTAIQQFFSATHPETQKYLSEISGETGYFTPSWQQFASTVEAGAVTPVAGVYRPLVEREPVVDIRQDIGWRLSSEDISDVSRHPNRSILMARRAEGLTCYRGAFPVRVDYTMSQEEYDTRQQAPWPAMNEETIQVDAFWPEATDLRHAEPSTTPSAEDRLSALERRLNEAGADS